MTKKTKNSRTIARGFAGQQEGEEIILVEHRHPVVLRKKLILGLLAVVVIILPWVIATANLYSWQNIANWIVFVGLIIVAFFALRAWVGWYYSVYVLTSYRVMIISQTGFFGREVNELALSNIQNVNYKISGMQASMLGYGNVTIETLSGSKPLRLRYIVKPVRFQRAVLEVLRRQDLDN